MRLSPSFAVLVLALLFGAAQAAPERIVENVGGVDLALPVPSGYAVARGADLIAMAELLTPFPLRVVAFFVDEAELRRRDTGEPLQMRRYFIVQTMSKLEGLTLADADIAALKADVRRQSSAVFDEGANSIGVLTGTRAPDGSITGSALTTVVLRGKVVYLNANSRLQSDADLDWLRAQSREWLARANAGNAAAPAASAPR